MRFTLPLLAAVALAVAEVVLWGGVQATELDDFSTKIHDQESRVVVDAESISYEQQGNLIRAQGAVRITYGLLTLTADRVTIDRETGEAEAGGLVELVAPSGTIEADFVHINFRQETGVVENGELRFGPRNLRVRGQRIRKLKGQKYEIIDGRLTTCLCAEGGPPSWNLRGERVIVDLHGNGRFRKGSFEILGRPVLYLPAGIFPVRKRRQSGLLRPRFGISSFRGVQLEQPIYWAINKSTDATVGIDVESGSRIGLVSEYRYVFSAGSRGELSASYFNETMRGLSSADVVNQRIADTSIPENRWSVRAWHDQELPAGIRAYVDVLRVGDDLLLREVNAFSFDPVVDVSMRTKRFAKSRVGLVKDFSRGVMHASARFYQDFINPDELTLDVAPEIRGYAERGFFAGRLVGRLEAQGVNFERDNGFQGRRLELQPALEIPWHWRDILHGYVESGVRASFYDLDDTDLPDGGTGGVASPLTRRTARRFFYTAAQLGTSLARVYDLSDASAGRLKHTIEPLVRYLYVPRGRQREAALFDELDRMRHRSVFRYGLTSRLLHRRGVNGDSGGTGGIREIGRLAIGQSYDLASEGSDGEQASDLDIGLRLVPADYLLIYGRSDVSVNSWRPRGTSVGFSISDPRPFSDEPVLAELRGRSRLEAAYRFVTGQDQVSSLATVSEEETGNSRVEEVNARLVLRTTGRLFLAAETRYDAVSKRFLENRYGIRIISKCDCWVVDLGVTDRVNPDEVVVQATVTLVGLGSLGQGSGGRWQGNGLSRGWPALF